MGSINVKKDNVIYIASYRRQENEQWSLLRKFYG